MAESRAQEESENTTYLDTLGHDLCDVILVSTMSPGTSSSTPMELTSGPQWSPPKTTMLYDDIVAL